MRQLLVIAMGVVLWGCGGDGGGGGGGGGGSAPPVAAASVDPTSGPAPLVVGFNATASTDPDDAIVSYAWTFGDGTSGSGAVVDHTYPTPGDYTASLTVTDAAGHSVSVTVAAIHVDAAGPPQPPSQPTQGPGSSDYVAATVLRTDYGSGASAYSIFEPRDPRPAQAPVVVFLHGWNSPTWEVYGGWIHHLTRRGAIVIYPVYQTFPGQTLQAVTYTQNAIDAAVAAFTELETGDHVRPDRSRFAVAGHSFGGVMTANFGVRLAAGGVLPRPLALICAEPGSAIPATWDDHSQIYPQTLALVIKGEDDGAAGSMPDTLWSRLTSISSVDKDFILLRSDWRFTNPSDPSKPYLSSDHLAPASGVSGQFTDALDWYGFWKWGDALLSAAWTGTYREYALGNTPQQRYMGRWSDGVPLTEPLITD